MATINRIWIGSAGNVLIGVFALDHCDPHATCRDQNRQWTVRINFSFIDDVVTLRDVIPSVSHVPGHVLDQLKATVEGNLTAYRAKWWHYQRANPASNATGACCLNNKTVQGRLEASAAFDPVNSKTTVAFADGTVYEWPP